MSEEQLPGGEFSVFQFFPNGHAPHEFDCTECGRHVVDVSGEVRERCACCIHVPLWYEDPTVARILDPDHHRTRHEERQ